MSENLLEFVTHALRDSEIIRAVRQVRDDNGLAWALGDVRERSLNEKEILLLESLGNLAEDWGRVKVADGINLRRIRQNRFQGDVVLGRFFGSAQLAEGIKLPTGVYNSTLADCVVGHDALIRNVGLLAYYVVGAGVVLSDCGSIACTGRTTFGNGHSIPVGIEVGGRDLPVFAEITLPLCASLTRHPERAEQLSEYQVLIADYLNRVSSTRGIIETGAVVRNTPKVSNCYVGPYAAVEEAGVVDSCTLLSTATEPTRIQSGAAVHNSLLQWGSSCSGGALVEHSVLLEHCHVERHGKVTTSILGPNTVIGQGEVTASLVGPFVACHHQSMLIAVRWPEGRGNVSHGASVGCNHTSRAPDQECWLGEGTFLGLGVKVKYPQNLSLAPYCVIACGVELAPQKLVFPFSLVNTAAQHWTGVPGDCNELVPAWVLSDNLYAVRRTVSKFRARNRATRHAFDLELFRPEIIERLGDAGRRLRVVERIRDIYTEHQIPGLGKNYLTEAHRRRAIATYEFFVRGDAFLGLLRQVRLGLEHLARGSWEQILAQRSEDSVWEKQRQYLVDELQLTDPAIALRELPAMLEHIGLEVERSKRRDDRRGPLIIDDYSDVHTPAARDPIVRETWDDVQRLQAEVRHVLTEMGAPPARAFEPALVAAAY